MRTASVIFHLSLTQYPITVYSAELLGFCTLTETHKHQTMRINKVTN